MKIGLIMENSQAAKNEIVFDTQELLKGAISGANFEDLFFPNCQDAAIAEYLRSVLA